MGHRGLFASGKKHQRQAHGPSAQYLRARPIDPAHPIPPQPTHARRRLFRAWKDALPGLSPPRERMTKAVTTRRPHVRDASRRRRRRRPNCLPNAPPNLSPTDPRTAHPCTFCTPPSHVHAAPHAPAHRSPRAPLEARLASHRPLLKQEQGLPERAVLHIRTCHGRAQSPLPTHISGRATLRAAAFVVASAPVGRRCARCPALGVHRPTSGGCGVRCSALDARHSALGVQH